MSYLLDKMIDLIPAYGNENEKIKSYAVKFDLKKHRKDIDD